MLSGLQPHHHTPEPQTALAASPSRQMGSARLISHLPKPSCSHIPWFQSGGGTEGAGRARQLPRSYKIQDTAENPCTELRRPLRCPHGPILDWILEVSGANLPGEGDRSAAIGSPLVTPANPCHHCQSLCVRASCHPTLTPAIHQASSVSRQLLFLNLISVKYFGFKLFCSLPRFGSASPSRQNNLVVSETDSP